MIFNIYNEDCSSTMSKMKSNHLSVDLILTSPPYNMTKRKGGYADTGRYDVYKDWKDEKEYIDWIVSIFNQYNEILIPNGVVLFNFSYSIENPSLPYKLVSKICEATDFDLVDTILWKKKNGVPFPANPRRLSRIWEYVFVFVRKSETDTYNCNRQIKSISEKTGQKYYEVVYNYIDAKNNDEKCNLNQATFSSDLCEQLLSIYALDNSTVYDSFNGTGTTGVACKKMGLNYIGNEISKEQCEYSINRINNA